MLCEALRVPLLHESDNGDRQTGSEKVKFPAEAICHWAYRPFWPVFEDSLFSTVGLS